MTKRIDIQTKAGCHQVILHDDYLLIPCLLMDEIRIFKRSEDFALVKILKFPQGTGPRHGVFNSEHTRFYLVSELSNEFLLTMLKICILNLSLKLHWCRRRDNRKLLLLLSGLQEMRPVCIFPRVVRIY